jgi:16S rRNA (uracil1498-N3)-methyltransferase
MDGSEAHHFLHVVRGKAGDSITLFDGLGEELVARATKITRGTVDFEITDRQAISRELPVKLVVGVALPKGDRQKWLMEKLTELGVGQVVPLETARGVAQPTEQALARLMRSVIEASKQCGRNCLMQVRPAESLETFFSRGSDGNRLRLFADTQAVGEQSLSPPPTGSEIWIAVGPEGGWTDAERQLAQQHSWQSTLLGDRTLRVETAAVALAAWAGLACNR